VLLSKTEKARAAIGAGMRALSQKQQGLLLLADGSRSVLEIASLFSGEGEQILLELMRDGYLAVLPTAAPAGLARPAVPVSQAAPAAPEFAR
jgi:hypothetical protein